MERLQWRLPFFWMESIIRSADNFLAWHDRMHREVIVCQRVLWNILSTNIGFAYSGTLLN